MPQNQRGKRRPAARSKILIIATGPRRQSIASTSLVAKLTGFFPNARLDIVCRAGDEPLFEHLPGAKHVLAWDPGRKHVSARRVMRVTRRARYDLVVNTQRTLVAGIITAHTRAPIKTGYRRSPLSICLQNKADYDPAQGEVERQHRLIAFLTDSRPAPTAVAIPAKEAYDMRRHQQRPYVVIDAGADGPSGRLPAATWGEVARRNAPRHAAILTGDAADSGYCRQIAQAAGPEAATTDLCGQLSLLEKAALMRGAAMVYTHDSDAFALAQAAGAPATAAFCATTPAGRHSAASPRARAVEPRPSPPCRPCGRADTQNCPQGQHRCAQQINIDDLTA